MSKIYTGNGWDGDDFVEIITKEGIFRIEISKNDIVNVRIWSNNEGKSIFDKEFNFSLKDFTNPKGR